MPDSLLSVANVATDLEPYREGFVLIAGGLTAFCLELAQRHWKEMPERGPQVVVFVTSALVAVLFQWSYGAAIEFKVTWQLMFIAIGAAAVTHGFVIKNTKLGAAINPSGNGGIIGNARKAEIDAKREGGN